MMIITEHTWVAIAMCAALAFSVYRTGDGALGFVGLIVIGIFWGVTR